ncbi:MAG: hypothetical protein R3E79_31085 [Caldilineaceae bacterium]
MGNLGRIALLQGDLTTAHHFLQQAVATATVGILPPVLAKTKNPRALTTFIS